MYAWGYERGCVPVTAWINVSTDGGIRAGENGSEGTRQGRRACEITYRLSPKTSSLLNNAWRASSCQ
eukprot:365412-Chlamydomonas_euryale.AAC.8